MAFLFQHLAGWNAYDRIRAAMIGKGFSLHETFVRVLAEVSGAKSTSLETYWREAAREYVSSAGKSNSNTRTFLPDIGYRSNYLESLAARLPPEDSKETYLSLLPELREIDREAHSGGPRFGIVRELTAKAKFQEYADIVNYAKDDIRTKKNQFEVFAALAQEVGFVRKRNSVSKCNEKISLKVVADLGGRKDANGIQFSIHVYDENEPNLIFYVFPDKILPGIGYYTIYPDFDGGMHGLKAMCCFCDVFFRSL